MLWVVVPAAVLVVGGVFAFLFGPDFEPASKDDASVEKAIFGRMVDRRRGR